MYGLLIFILCKDLKAPLLYYTILIALKPLVSLFSPYWSALIYKRPDKLRTNIISAEIIAHLPFFLFPFIQSAQSAWFLVASGALFLMMKRGVIPAWMEILKLNVREKHRKRTFSTGSTLSYVGGIILPFVFGRWMDLKPQAWQWLFPITALFSLSGTLFLLRIPIPKTPTNLSPSPLNIKAALLKPWKNSWQILKARPDFVRFQIGFMIGGGSLMIMQPALPIFFDQILNLSYTEIAIAISTCKGIGFVLTSRFWAKRLNSQSIFRFSALVILITTCLPLGLLLAQSQIIWIWVAYLMYGVMQAGSKLSWHLCGPLFAGAEDSSVYSSVNVVAVGLRGLFAPFLGSLLTLAFGAPTVLVLSSVLFILGALQLNRAHLRYAPKPQIPS